MSSCIDRITRLSLLVSTAFGLMLGACGGSGTIDGMDGGSPAPELREVIVEVSYEPNAEPYTGSVPLGGDTWGLFESNMVALFEGTGITVSSPSRLEQMTEMEDLPDTDFDVDRILALDEAYRRTGASPGRRVFHALWLDGYFSDGERQSGVIGVSIGNTGVIAIFKPVVASLGITDAVRRFGEQTTLIHEVGHAIGLVNRGIPMQRPHHDAERGAHCDDEECVMFWANEGPGDLAEFVGRYVTAGNTVVFDDDCLADVRGAFAP